MSQVNSAEEHKLVSSFESIRRTLLQEEYKDRLEKPLAYWALPNDRRLPLAFLGRPLGELLQSSFSDLSATRGIGRKKISSLVRLLHRVTSDEPPAAPFGLKDLADELEAARSQRSNDPPSANGAFDPSVVSEGMWLQWCMTVRRFRLGRETLGRVAPSLQMLPTVIWDTPLSVYENKTLAQIRQMRTHGEKRVRVVMEILHAVDRLLRGADPSDHLSIHLVPRFVPDVEEYLHHLARKDPIDAPRDEFAQRLVVPLLDQVLVDSGESVQRLAAGRLGIGGPQKSVREQAKELGVTRARVYQLLEDCSRVMAVRWPQGAVALHGLTNIQSPETRQLVVGTRKLFFPGSADAAELKVALELDD